jgi:predicted phosphodiesterase
MIALVPLLNAQSYKFVVWGDSQFQNPDVFEKTVKETELLKPSFVLHVGDMIHGHTYSMDIVRKEWKRFKKQIAPLSMPFYPTAGNHDMTTKETQPAYEEAWGKDRLYYSFNYLNTHVTVVNTQLNQDFEKITPEEFEWLKNDLEKASSDSSIKNIFVTMHAPLYLKDGYDWQPVQALFKKNRVNAVFTGHYHTYDYRNIDGIDYISLNSSGNMTVKNFAAGFAHCFLVVSVADSKIDYAVIAEDGIHRIDEIAPGEASHSDRFLEANKAITINNPERCGTDTTVTIKVKNKQNTPVEYKLGWLTDNYKWSFEPWGVNATLGAKETREFSFSVKGPKGEFLRTEMPKLKASFSYKTLSGSMNESVYYYEIFNPPVVKAGRTSRSIKVDGIEENAWREIKANDYAIHDLVTDYKSTPAIDSTSVKILYDKNNLYVFIKGREPNPSKLAALAYGDVPFVFGDDDFEIYFDPARDLQNYFRIMVNPKGTILANGPKGLYSFKFDVKTFTGTDYWSAEFKIPFSELSCKCPAPGEKWGFNVRRQRTQADPAQSDWSKMAEHPPYEPEHFGVLIF